MREPKQDEVHQSMDACESDGGSEDNSRCRMTGDRGPAGDRGPLGDKYPGDINGDIYLVETRDGDLRYPTEKELDRIVRAEMAWIRWLEFKWWSKEILFLIGCLIIAWGITVTIYPI